MVRKRNNNLVKAFLSVVTLALLAVLFTPYIPLREGSFLWAVLLKLNEISFTYIGWNFPAPFESLSLLPVAVLMMFMTFDAFIHANIFTVLVEFLFYASLFISGIDLMNIQNSWVLKFADQRLFTVCFYASNIFAVTLLILAIFSVAAAVKDGVKNRKKKAVKTSCKSQSCFSGNNGPVSRSQAIDMLKNLDVPEFQIFPNVADESGVNFSAYKPLFELSEMERENVAARQDEERKRLIEVGQALGFKKLQKELEEDILVRQATSNNLNQTVIDIEDIPDEPEETFLNSAETPQEQPSSKSEAEIDVEVKSRKDGQNIILEGSNGDDDLAKAQEEMSRLSDRDDSDFISGVGGLKSAKNGDYLYDASKFTYKFPPENLLHHYDKTSSMTDEEARNQGYVIVQTLKEFKIETQLLGIQHGPTFTLYELSLAKGIRVNAVLNLSDNIAMELAVPSVRVLAPIPGKSAIGVEVPNKKRDTIGFDEMMPALKSKNLKIPMVLGKTITGDSIVVDLAGAPHMLIAGTTGSGKSVCVNSLICSVLYTKTPRDVRMILVDPKMVELSVYNEIPHLLTPVITEPKKAIKVMAFCVEEMERRMRMFSQLNARKIEDYNQKIQEKGLLRAKLPYIMVIIDEFADLMSVVGKELESYVKRITAVARFTGIHLVLATQRPDASVITGIIKSNMPTQIAFQVSNLVNSRIILDGPGAEKLLGRGDMLYASSTSPAPVRIQGAFIDHEVEQIVSFVKTQGQPDYIDESYFEDDDDEDSNGPALPESSGGEDMFTKAWHIVADRGEASASYLQRKLSIGYNRAATLIEQLEEAGYIGPSRGAKPREILRYPDSRTEKGPEY